MEKEEMLPCLQEAILCYIGAHRHAEMRSEEIITSHNLILTPTCMYFSATGGTRKCNGKTRYTGSLEFKTKEHVVSYCIIKLIQLKLIERSDDSYDSYMLTDLGVKYIADNIRAKAETKCNILKKHLYLDVDFDVEENNGMCCETQDDIQYDIQDDMHDEESTDQNDKGLIREMSEQHAFVDKLRKKNNVRLVSESGDRVKCKVLHVCVNDGGAYIVVSPIRRLSGVANVVFVLKHDHGAVVAITGDERNKILDDWKIKSEEQG